MKHFFSGMMIALSLALVLVLGIAALAESEAQTPELPAASDMQAPPEAQAPAEVQAPDDTQATQEDADLQAALKAFSEARQSSREQNLQDELDGYVAAGKLTQDQADLIMKQYKEREAQRNGTCPNCGYQLQNGKGGRMNGGFGRGGKGGSGKGGRMNGGFGGQMNGGFGGQMMQGQDNGMMGQSDMQSAPKTPGNGGL